MSSEKQKWWKQKPGSSTDKTGENERWGGVAAWQKHQAWCMDLLSTRSQCIIKNTETTCQYVLLWGTKVVGVAVSEPCLHEQHPWRALHGAGACGEAFDWDWAAGCTAGLGGTTKPCIVSRFTQDCFNRTPNKALVIVALSFLVFRSVTIRDG